MATPLSALITFDWKGITLFVAVAAVVVMAFAGASPKGEVIQHPPHPLQVDQVPTKPITTHGECSIFYFEFEGRRFLGNSAGGLIEVPSPEPTIASVPANPQTTDAPTAKKVAAIPSPEGLGSGSKPVIQVQQANDYKTTQILMGQSDEWPVK